MRHSKTCTHCVYSTAFKCITNCTAGRAVAVYMRSHCKAKYGEAVFKYNTERNKKNLERKKLEIL